MDWLLYLPAIASPIAVLVAYLLLKASGKKLKKQTAQSVAASILEGRSDIINNVVVDAEHGDTITATFHREHA